MAKLSASFLSADFLHLRAELDDMPRVGADYAHVDIMDGIFVPNLAMGFPMLAAMRKATAVPLDVHLMIDRPLRYVDRFCEAGSDILTIHLEADTPEHTRTALERIRQHGVKPGISIKPNTPAQAVLPYLELVDLILVMTVEPGFGGQSFMEDMMPKLRQIRQYIDEKNSECELEVDGGINQQTAEIAKKNGANVLVLGSAFFGAADRLSLAASVKADCR